MPSVPSENILKLRELTEKMYKEIKEEEYEFIIKKIKKIVDEGKCEVKNLHSLESKIKNYESMYSTITNLLTNVKFK